jgi:hypothetical protein
MGRRKQVKTNQKPTAVRDQKKEVETERKTFVDRTFSSWFLEDDETMRVGKTLAEIMKGECETLEVRDIFYGDPSNTWRIIITTDDQIHLLKSSRQLK